MLIKIEKFNENHISHGLEFQYSAERQHMLCICCEQHQPEVWKLVPRIGFRYAGAINWLLK